jgi:hypothetical protein
MMPAKHANANNKGYENSSSNNNTYYCAYSNSLAAVRNLGISGNS